MNDTLEKLQVAILEYDTSRAKILALKSIDEGIDPLRTIDALTKTIKQVGDSFNNEELWLPDLIGAASAMQAAMPILEEQIKKSGKIRRSSGIVVIGTVFGDIHNIGKDMVATLLAADGYQVIDLGVNINADQFISAIKEHQPDLLAMSSLMTMTAPEQGKVIDTLKNENLREKTKIIVGGGAITKDFADEIGADGYGAAATDAVDLARELLGREE
jgi:methanogenic corrinoid protein MtbC1